MAINNDLKQTIARKTAIKIPVTIQADFNVNSDRCDCVEQCIYSALCLARVDGTKKYNRKSCEALR
jgi:hypothetical protein